MPRETILVKLGGSLVTDKRRPLTLRQEVLTRLAQEIADSHPRMKEQLVLSHGSGSFGHAAAASYDLREGVRSRRHRHGVSVTQDGAARLHRHVIAALIECQLDAFSLAPSSFMVAANGRPVGMMVEPLLQALRLGMVPVTFGDVVLDRERGVAICSTETVLRSLASRLPRHGWTITRVVWLGETDGVYDETGRTIPLVSKKNLGQTLAALGDPAGIDVTGGMRHRLNTAWSLAQRGIRCQILNGLEPGILRQALLDEEVPGTEVVSGADGPQGKTRSGRS